MQDDDLCRKAVEFACALRDLIHGDEEGFFCDHDEIARALARHFGEIGQRVNIVRLLVSLAQEDCLPDSPCFPLHAGYVAFQEVYLSEGQEVLHDAVH